MVRVISRASSEHWQKTDTHKLQGKAAQPSAKHMNVHRQASSKDITIYKMNVQLRFTALLPHSERHTGRCQ